MTRACCTRRLPLLPAPALCMPRCAALAAPCSLCPAFPSPATAPPPLHCRAYAFRSATEAQRRQRIPRVYQLAPGTPPVGPVALAPPPAALVGLPPLPPGLLSRESLGWEPLDLAGTPPPQLPQRLGALLARCGGIDHSAPGVSHLLGGSAAGYVRWEAFRRRAGRAPLARRAGTGPRGPSPSPVPRFEGPPACQACPLRHAAPRTLHAACSGMRATLWPPPTLRRKGLSLYAARRNDPMLRDGTSRLSAYHHW